MNRNFEIHVLVQGNVQGVGFRATTCRVARNMELKGTVCNLPNGQVRIVVQASKEKVEELLKKVEEAIGPGHIAEVELINAPIVHLHENFNTIYDE